MRDINDHSDTDVFSPVVPMRIVVFTINAKRYNKIRTLVFEMNIDKNSI